jgi:hypothetical protein
MKTEIRLGSVGNGVGDPEALMLDFIYMYLLHEFDQDIYSRIGINQIGSDLEEFVVKEPGNKIHVNLKYPFFEDYKLKSSLEKNLIGLDIIHNALIRVVEYDGKLDIKKILAIREKILEKNFSFEFIYKIHVNKNDPRLVGKVVVHPLIDQFIYSVLIEEGGIEKCRQVIFNGCPGYFYADKFFCFGKWMDETDFIISGKEKEVEIRVSIAECKFELINLTPYKNPPYFTLMKYGITEEEKDSAKKDWEHSLHPAIAAVIRGAEN